MISHWFVNTSAEVETNACFSNAEFANVEYNAIISWVRCPNLFVTSLSGMLGEFT